MILQLNKTELVVLKDVFGKRLNEFGISTKTTLNQKLARKLHTMITEELDLATSYSHLCVLNDIMDRVS